MKALGLTSARSEGHSFETITEPIAELRGMYPTAGASALHVYLRTRFDMRVPRYVTMERGLSWRRTNP